MISGHDEDISWGAAAAPTEVADLKRTWERGNKAEVKKRIKLIKRTIKEHPKTPLAHVARHILGHIAKDGMISED